MGQVLFFFAATSVVSSLVLIDKYILSIQKVITHEEYLQYFFHLQRSYELPQKPWHHGHNNRNNLKVIFTKQFLTKVTIFCRFDVYFVRPEIFQVEAKISTVRSMFPDFLSVFYDYVSIQKSMERCSVELNLKRTNWIVQSDLYNPDRKSISAHLDLISCGLDLYSSKLNNDIIVDS